MVLFRADEYGFQAVYMYSENDEAEVEISSWRIVIKNTPATAIFIYKTPDKIDVLTHTVNVNDYYGDYCSFSPNKELKLYGSESSGLTFADITSFIVKKTI